MKGETDVRLVTNLRRYVCNGNICGEFKELWVLIANLITLVIKLFSNCKLSIPSKDFCKSSSHFCLSI